MSTATVICIIDHLAMGGTERRLVDLVPALEDHGISTCVITFFPGLMDHILVDKGIRLVTLPPMSKVTRIPALTEYLHSLRPDIVHTRLFSAGLWGRIAALLAGVPRLVHTHGGFTFADKRWKRLLPEKLLDLRTDASVCVSHALKEHLVTKGYLSSKKLVVIPNGICASEFLRIPLRTPRVPARLICVGRLEHVKGQDILIRSLPDMSDIVKDLCLVGDGTEMAMLGQLASDLGVRDKVSFLGTRRDIPELLATADMYVAPSRSEGLSGAILEAMAAGLPVIGTDVGGNREVLEHAGWVIPMEDPDALAQAVRTALENPAAAKQTALAGRTRVEEAYTIEKMVEAHAALYLKVKNSA